MHIRHSKNVPAMLFSLGIFMKSSPKHNCDNRGMNEWPGEKLWQKLDNVSASFDHPAFIYVPIALFILGTVLGIIADLLRN